MKPNINRLRQVYIDQDMVKVQDVNLYGSVICIRVCSCHLMDLLDLFFWASSFEAFTQRMAKGRRDKKEDGNQPEYTSIHSETSWSSLGQSEIYKGYSPRIFFKTYI